MRRYTKSRGSMRRNTMHSNRDDKCLTEISKEVLTVLSPISILLFVLAVLMTSPSTSIIYIVAAMLVTVALALLPFVLTLVSKISEHVKYRSPFTTSVNIDTLRNPKRFYGTARRSNQ